MIEELCKACSDYQEVSLFGSDDSLVEETAVKYLEKKGYRVVQPVDLPIKIKNSMDLKNLYEGLVDRYHPEWMKVYIKDEQARAIAKNFVKSRMEAENISKERALQECAEIIYTVFKYEEEFKFKTQISFAWFGQGELKWVSDRAIEILNKNRDALKEAEADRMIEEMYDNLPQRGWSAAELDAAYNKNVLKEKANGKEENKERGGAR